MSEKLVENAVIKHFCKAGFRCLPNRAKGWNRFSVYDDRAWEPDIVAFKWDKDNVVLNVIGIECKKNGSNATIMSALEQVKSYQRHFSWCYIATAESKRMVKSDLEFLRKHHRVGYIPVKMKGKSISVIESKTLDTYPNYLNHNLSLSLADATRQKLVMLDVFAGKFRNIGCHFRGELGWVWTNEDVQYQMTNYHPQKSVQFGINIESRNALQSKVKGRLSSLITWLCEKDFHDFRITFRRKEYPRSRPRAAVSSTIMQKSCADLRSSDADVLELKMEEYGHRMQMLIQKTVWDQNDILFRQDYFGRVNEAKSVLDDLRKAMRW